MRSSTAVGVLTNLTEEELARLKDINDIIADNDPTEMKWLIQILKGKEIVEGEEKGLPWRLIYIFSEQSESLSELLETNKELNEHWEKLLREKNYPDHDIVSVDKRKTLSKFSQLKGAFLITQLNADPNLSSPTSMAILDKACKIGMFRALIKRLQYNIPKFIEASSRHDGDKAREYMQVISKDIAKLCNLYWGIGHINSGFALLQLVDFYYSNKGHVDANDRYLGAAQVTPGFFNFSWEKAYDDKDLPLCLKTLKLALELLYKVEMLSNFQESHLISHQITHGEGILSPYAETFTTVDELKQLIKLKLVNCLADEEGRFVAPFMEIAAKRAQIDLKKTMGLTMSHERE